MRNARWNDVAAAMAFAQVDGMFGKRKASCDFAKSVATAFPLIIGAYFAYEPDADGQDAAALAGGEVPREAARRLGPLPALLVRRLRRRAAGAGRSS